MIDRLRTISMRVIWLRPFFYGLTLIAAGQFGYIVLFEDAASKDSYLIPCVVALLWTFVSALMLTVFPLVPSKPDKGVHTLQRMKIRLVRGLYHIVSWFFVAITLSIVWLSIRLLNID